MKLPRRTALKLASIGAATVFTGRVALAQPPTPRTRRSLNGMSLDDPDLSAYRDFVGIMLAKDQAKPLSWLGFANQHGSKSGGYRFCPHGDWYFLPWHRAYVLMYEQAVQVLTGKQDFAMPYWNWTEMRTLPTAFTDPQYNGKPNPLYVPNRKKLNLPDSIVGQKEVMDKIFAETQFEMFGTSKNKKQKNLDPKWVVLGGGSQGILESTPHNLVHNDIGVFMPTPASPRDPIFFMHHCNIDRIWNDWNSLGNTNSTDPLWLNMPFTNNYLKPDGTPYSATVKDLQDIGALGYRYDVTLKPSTEKPDTSRDELKIAALRSEPGSQLAKTQRFGGKNRKLASALSPLAQSMSLNESSFEAVTAPKEGKVEEVYVFIGDMKLGDDVKGVRVFVDHPDLSVATPDTDPHYVTTIGFLNHWAHSGDDANTDAEKTLSVHVNLTSTLKRLNELSRLKVGEINVQLIPIPEEGVMIDLVGPVVPGSIDIVVL